MIHLPILHAGVREDFPDVSEALDEPEGLLAAGGDLTPARLLDAYRHGIFPWYGEGEPILWWSPNPRTVFDTGNIRVSTRFRRWLRNCDWTIRADHAFLDVMRACAAPRAGQPGTWITRDMLAAYDALHALGYAHSIEVYSVDGRIAGGIYGVAIGRMFFGESMFSKATNGSKVALLALCHTLHAWRFPLLDAQVASPHLATLGAYEMPRERFVQRVAELCAGPEHAGSWRERWPTMQAADLIESPGKEC